MKKFVIIFLLVAALAGGGWYYYKYHWNKLSPRESFEQMMAAAAVGDRERFVEGFTKESGRLMDAFVTLAETYDEVADAPYRNLVGASVEAERVAKDGKAFVAVKWGNRDFEVPFVLEDGEWKLDGFALEDTLR